MAKNVVKKKQRIAHNKTCDEDHEMLSEGNDLLYGIFQDMKKNNDLTAIHFTSFETNLSETSKTFTQQKIQNNAILIPNQNHIGVSKSKAFGPSRKFPLMEKCARDLKQIKHNRQMPKPRAHLSVLLKSPTPKAHRIPLSNSPKPNAHRIPLSNSPKPNAHRIPLSNSPKPKTHRIPLSNSLKPKAHCIPLSNSSSNLVSDAKSKKTEVVGKDKNNSSNSQNRKLTEALGHDRVPAYETKVKKNFSNERKDEEMASKNCHSIMKKNSVEENSHLTSNNLDQTGDNSSGSDEYETFIKKVCPKKSKNKKDSKKPQKSTTKLIKKHISKPISSESDSDPSDDETPVASKTNNKNCKKLKKSHEITDNRQSTTSKKDVASKSKKVRKKCNSRTVSKSVSSEIDSDINESPKWCYATRSKRIKRSNEVLDNRQSISKDDSESEMDIVNDETYHDSSSESGDLPSISDLQSNSYTRSSQFSEQSDAHIPVLVCNSLSPNTSVNNSLVFSNQLNEAISSKTSDIASVLSNDNDYISNKTSDISSLSANELKPVLQNETSDTAISAGSDQKNIPYKTSVIPSLVSSAQLNSSCKTSGTASLVNSDHPNVLHKMSVSSFVGSNKLNECLAAKTGSLLNNSKEDDFSKSTIVDLTESDNECENSFSIMPKIIMTSGQISNESELHSEESDIELLDVIVTELPEKSKTNCSTKNVGSSCSNDSTNTLIVKTEKIDQTLTCSNAKSQNTPQLQTPLNGKYEVAYSTGICQDYDKKAESKDKTISQFNLSNELKNNIVTNAVNTQISSKEVKKEPLDDCEIVFDIASTNNLNQNLPGVQNCSNAKIKAERDSKCVKGVTSNGVAKSACITNEQSNQSSIVSNTENSLILSKNIKKEACDDDCEIVLDIATSSIPNQKLPSVQICNNRNVKIERDSKAAKQVTPVLIAGDGSITTERKNKLSQKLHEVACSNFRNLNSSCNKNSELLGKEIDLDTMNIKALLQDLKKEFATYQDILHTEQSVENTFKLLERCQAEKLVSLKSKITQCLEIVPGISDCNSIKNAVDKLLDSSELSSSSSLKDCSEFPSVCHNISSVSDISVQDLKTFATMNLVPLSSIPENDIKPNLSELKCALKQEANTSCEINSMSFGEKCVVCAKDASAACQQCAKVFFCSNICGRKYWEGGHKNSCAK